MATLHQHNIGSFLSNTVQLALGILCIVACLEAFRRSRNIARYVWRLLAATFAIWAVGQALGTYADLFGNQTIDAVDNTIYFLSLIPLGMLPFLDPNGEPNSFDKLHVLDFVQVCIFWISIFLCFSPRVWSPSTALTIGPFALSQSLAFDGLLVATFSLRAFLSRSNGIRAFFLRMAFFLLLSGLADSYALNPKQSLQDGGWFDLTWSVLLALPVLIARAWNSTDAMETTVSASESAVVNQFFPLLYPLFSFFLLASVEPAYPFLSRGIFALAFVTFAARVLVIQKRQQRTDALLVADVAERKHVEEALRESETQYRLLFLTNPVPMWVFDRTTLKFLAVNESAIRHYGFSEQEFLSMTIVEIRPQQDISRLLQATQQRISGLQDPQTWRHQKKDGTVIEVEIVSHDLRFHGIEAELIAAYDITQRTESERALRRAEEKYRAIFEDAVIGIFQATPDGRPLSINRALAEIHGYDSPAQLMAEVANLVSELFVHPDQMEETGKVLAEKGVARNIELELYRKDRSQRSVLANLRGVRDADGRLTLIEGTMEDITDRKQAEERVQFLAYYDALTGLPNRTLLQDRLGKALAGAHRRKEKVAVMFLDLDRFKIINDSLGHSIGDQLLQNVAERLKKWSREQDTVARIGGDEFVIVLGGIKDVPDVAIAAERVMDTMIADLRIQDHKFNVSCSIGISLYPDHGLDSETLIKNADAAMYSAKESGRNVFRFFTNEMNVQVVERLTIERNLRLALERDEFFLVYQPQMDIRSGQIAGMEALIRWRQPELGVMSPDRFIRVAENSGLILPIGEWVLKTACRAARDWQEQGLPPVPVAVNVSAIQFRQEGFAALVRNVLQTTGLAPHYLELEVTESLLLSNADRSLAVLHEIKAMGVKLAIDDFGTGYSSLSYLKHLPVNKLKIDRSFIKMVALNAGDAAITAAIIGMAKSLNLKVIAEGVEDAAQLSFLEAHQCDEIQGYYFSKPLISDEITAKLRRDASESSFVIALSGPNPSK